MTGDMGKYDTGRAARLLESMPDFIYQRGVESQWKVRTNSRDYMEKTGLSVIIRDFSGKAQEFFHILQKRDDAARKGVGP